MWFSARPVSMNGTSSAPSGLGGGRDPIGGVTDLIETTAIAIEVLDRATHGARGRDPGDGERRVLGLGAVPVLEVDRHRHVGRRGHRRRVGHRLVGRDLPVPAPEREREPGTGGGERLAPQRLHHPGRPGSPRGWG